MINKARCNHDNARWWPLLGLIVNRFLLCCCLLIGYVYAQDASDLEAIQQQIKDKQAALNKQLDKAKTLQTNLQQAELKVANTAKALNQTQKALVDNHQEQLSLQQRQKQYQTALQQQKSALAEQIRSAYMTGNYDFAKMLLNQEDAANFERTITYYQYLNNARKTQIEQFNAIVKELQKVNLQLVEKGQELKQLEERQVQQKQTLSAQQQERESRLKQLNNAIQSEELRIAQLQINEKSLQDAIAKAQARAEAKQNVSLTGLTKLKGKLLMPAEGQLRQMFGRFRQGQIKWKGVVIYGNVGSPVVAIHDAKVLYADWLRGFGLVTVLDHGNGYMSLYGHNQALLKQAGDTVTAGESIALLGESGGQSRPNLYFEIRHKGKPINPAGWLNL